MFDNQEGVEAKGSDSEAIEQEKVLPQLVIGIFNNTNSLVKIRFSYDAYILDGDLERKLLTMTSRVVETGLKITARFVQVVTLDGMKYILCLYQTVDKDDLPIMGLGLAKINPSTGLVSNTIAFSQSNGVSSSIDVMRVRPLSDAAFPTC